jgi:riboflavin synthase
MFTGIIEELGSVVWIRKEGSNQQICIESAIGNDLKIDQSISHNGVCLTVTKIDNNQHWVTAIDETLQRSNLGSLKVGDRVNLERCMIADGRFDGHVVQGHVDTTASTQNILEEDGSWLFDFQYEENDQVMVDKGSVTVNGVSLTCYNITPNSFRVAIIPYTNEHTNFGELKIGDFVNIEFDIIGKYVQKLLAGRV